MGNKKDWRKAFCKFKSLLLFRDAEFKVFWGFIGQPLLIIGFKDDVVVEVCELFNEVCGKLKAGELRTFDKPAKKLFDWVGCGLSVGIE